MRRGGKIVSPNRGWGATPSPFSSGGPPKVFDARHPSCSSASRNLRPLRRRHRRQEPTVGFMGFVETNTPGVQELEVTRAISDCRRPGHIVMFGGRAIRAKALDPQESPMDDSDHRRLRAVAREEAAPC